MARSSAADSVSPRPLTYARNSPSSPALICVASCAFPLVGFVGTLEDISAERAASQILDACRHGDAELVITVQAKLAVLARNLAPELFADALEMMNRLLPAPAASGGDQARPGRESESEWAGPPSPLTAATYKAAEKNNEM